MLEKIWHTIGNYVVITVIFIICLWLFVFGMKGPSKDYIQGILSNMMEQQRIEYEVKIKEKEILLKERDKRITALSSQLKKSSEEYKKIKAEIDKLKTEVISIEEPKDLEEIKNRLRNMGFNIR